MNYTWLEMRLVATLTLRKKEFNNISLTLKFLFLFKVNINLIQFVSFYLINLY